MNDLTFLDRYREAKARLWGEAIAKTPPAKVVVKRVPKHMPRDWLLLASPPFVSPSERPTPVGTAAAIVSEVCSLHGVDEYDLLGRRRQPHLDAARRDVYARLADGTNWSFPRIGKFVGRDHSSIVKSLQRNNPHLLRRAVKTGKEASVYFGVSISHVTQRMSDLRKKGQTTKFWREPKTTLPSKNSKARWDIDVEREAARGPYVPVRECEAFLAALSEHEKPPVETTVRTRQPLMRNPSLVTGSCCSSSSGWE